MEGVEAGDAVAEEEASGVLERVAVGEREREGDVVAEAVAAAEPEAKAVPVAKNDPVAAMLPVDSTVGEGEVVPGLVGVFWPNVGDTETLTVAEKVAVTVADCVPVGLTVAVDLALPENTLLLVAKGVAVEVGEAEKEVDSEALTLGLGEEELSREPEGHIEGLPEVVMDTLSLAVTVPLVVTRVVAELESVTALLWETMGVAV